MVMPRFLKNTPGCPQANWSWLRCTDLKEDEGRDFEDYEDCEFCGHESIRFVHELEHPDWPEVIRVGRICAEHYTTTSGAQIKKAENIVRNRSQRRQRFPNHRSWKLSQNGNSYIDYLGFHVLVVRRGVSAYALKIGKNWGTFTYKSDKEAKLKAFDFITRRISRTSPSKG